MRDGRFVSRGETASFTRQQMANLMVGREMSDMFPQAAAAGGHRDSPRGERALRPRLGD